MDIILKKLGLYDFMGIWGPGAIAVTYFYLSGHSFFCNIFTPLDMPSIVLSQEYFFVFLYTVGAYTLGVVLNELGRLLWKIFHLGFNNITYFSNQKCKNLLYPIWKMRWNYNESIDLIKTIEGKHSLKDILCGEHSFLSFELARATLKYDKNIDCTRIDTYHSIFGLARSLWVTSILHLGCTLISFLNQTNNIPWGFIIIDIILGLLFFCRAYHYCLSWAKNMYIQYYLCIYSTKDDKKVNQNESH